MDNHISDIYIRSFRGISNLELKDIKLINILTGDNNGGKTSVLEVIQSIKNPFDFRTWRSLIRRGERISVIRGMSYYEGFYDLFDINKEEKIIEYDVCLINGQKYNVKVIAERVEEEIMEKDLVKLQGDYNAMDEDSLQDNFLNVSKLNLKELDEGNVQQNIYSKKLAQHISDLVGVNGNMKFLFIRDEADNCWIGVLLPEMAGSYLWDINMCQKKEYLPKNYKEEIIISIYRKFWNLLEKEEIEHCYFISNCLVSGISDYRLAIYYTAMYAYTLAKQMAAIQRRCKKIESRLSLNQPLVVDETGTLLDIYVYQSYQLENIEIKEFRDGLTLMEHMVLKYLLQERDIENSIGYGYRMRKIIEHAKISLRQKAVEYYGWSYIRSMFA